MGMLYECHAHIALDGADFRRALARHTSAPDETWVRARLEEYRAAGAGYVRDGGDNLGVSLLAVRLAPEYGITYRSPAFAIHKKGRYGGFLGREWSDMGEYRALVAEVRRLGGDFIKLMLSGIMDFSEYGKMSCEPLEAEEIRELIGIAHGEGFAVMAHCNGADAVKAAVEAGVDSIEHGYYLDEQAISDLAASDTVWVPTFAPVANLVGSGKFPDAVLKKIVEQHALDVKRAEYTGGLLAPGSDGGAFAVPQGQGIRDEYAYLETMVSQQALEEGAMLLENIFKRKQD